jgi:hypothetical protein
MEVSCRGQKRRALWAKKKGEKQKAQLKLYKVLAEKE